MNTHQIYPFSTEDGERNGDFVVEVKYPDNGITKRVRWIEYLRQKVAERSDVVLDSSAACSGCAYLTIEGPMIGGVDLSIFLCTYHQKGIISGDDLDDLVCPQWSMCPINAAFIRGHSNGEIE